VTATAETKEPPPTIRFEVTAAHLAAGVPNNAAACPIARSLRAHTGVHVAAMPDWIHIKGGPYRGWHRTPDAIWGFMDAFDDGRDVEPAVFELEVSL
jgi:hypothetical protein